MRAPSHKTKKVEESQRLPWSNIFSSILVLMGITFVLTGNAQTVSLTPGPVGSTAFDRVDTRIRLGGSTTPSPAVIPSPAAIPLFPIPGGSLPADGTDPSSLGLLPTLNLTPPSSVAPGTSVAIPGFPGFSPASGPAPFGSTGFFPGLSLPGGLRSPGSTGALGPALPAPTTPTPTGAVYPAGYIGPLPEGATREPAAPGGRGGGGGAAAAVLPAVANALGGKVAAALGLGGLGGGASCSVGGSGGQIPPAETAAAARPSGSAAQGAADTGNAASVVNNQLNQNVAAGTAAGTAPRVVSMAGRPGAATPTPGIPSINPGPLNRQPSPSRTVSEQTTVDGYISPTRSTSGGPTASAGRSTGLLTRGSQPVSTFDRIISGITSIAPIFTGGQNNQNQTTSGGGQSYGNDMCIAGEGCFGGTATAPTPAPATPATKLNLLLNVLAGIVNDVSNAPSSATGDAQLYQSLDIWNASIDKIADLFGAERTQANRTLIQNALTVMLGSLHQAQLNQADDARATAIGAAIARGGNLLARVNDVAITPDVNQLNAQLLFAQNNAAYRGAMQQIYDFTNDTGAGIPLENASQLAATIKQISDTYSAELEKAKVSGEYDKPAFVKAATNMRILTENLAELQAIAAGTNIYPGEDSSSGNYSAGSSGGSGGSDGGFGRIQEIAGALSSSGLIPPDQQRGLQSGLQALGALSQMGGQGANMGTFQNIASAISQSGVLSAQDSNDLGRAIGAFGQVQNLLQNNQGGVLGMLQTAQSIRSMFQSNPLLGGITGTMRGGSVGNVVSAAGRPGFATAAEAQAAATKKFSQRAGTAAAGTKTTADAAKGAADKGSGKPGAVADTGGGGGGAAGGVAGAVAGAIGGGNRGVPVNVLSGTPYFKLVTVIKDLNQQICKHVAKIEALQQEVRDKLFDKDRETNAAAVAALKEVNAEVLRETREGRTGVDGEKRAYDSGIEQHIAEYKSAARARLLEENKKLNLNPTIKKSIDKLVEDKLKRDKDETEFQAMVNTKSDGKGPNSAKTLEDYATAIGPSENPNFVALQYAAHIQNTLNRAEELAKVDYVAHQGSPPSLIIEATGKDIDGKAVATKFKPNPNEPGGGYQIGKAVKAATSPTDLLTQTQVVAQQANIGAGAAGPALARGGTPAPQPAGNGVNGGSGDFLSQLLNGLTALCAIKPDLGICGQQNNNNNNPPPPVETGVVPTVSLGFATSTVNAVLGATLNWTTDGATSCTTGNNWQSFGSATLPMFTVAPALASGATMPVSCVGGTCSQRVYFPNVFRMTVGITPAGSSVAGSGPDQSRSFVTTLTRTTPIPQKTVGTRITQTTVYTPSVRGVGIGDQITVDINGLAATATVGPAQINEKGIVTPGAISALIGAIKGTIPLRSTDVLAEFNKYELVALGGTLKITGFADSDTPLLDQADYQLSCQNTAGEGKDSVTIKFK